MEHVAPGWTPEPGDTVAFTDGSNTTTKPYRVSWAYVVQRGGVTIASQAGELLASEDALSMRNVAGEIAAAMRAVKWAKDHDTPVYLCYDYNA